MVMLYCRDKGEGPKLASQGQEASFCNGKAVAEQRMLCGTNTAWDDGLTSSPKTFGFFCLVFHVMELKVFLLCSEKGRNNDLCN